MACRFANWIRISFYVAMVLSYQILVTYCNLYVLSVLFSMYFIRAPFAFSSKLAHTFIHYSVSDLSSAKNGWARIMQMIDSKSWWAHWTAHVGCRSYPNPTVIISLPIIWQARLLLVKIINAIIIGYDCTLSRGMFRESEQSYYLSRNIYCNYILFICG